MKVVGFLALAAVVGIVAGLFFAPLAGDVLPSGGGHGAWYASRAAGIVSYLFIWLGLAGGLMMSSAWFDGFFGRARLLTIHQTGTIAGVVLGLFHGLILIPDGWTQFGFSDVLIPFASYYERGLSALGTMTLYLGIIVSGTFWVRSAIGKRAWKLIHYTSVLVYVGALWHGLMLGTDAREPWLLAIYLLTSSAVVFAIVVRITYSRVIVRKTPPAGAPPRKPVSAAGTIAPAAPPPVNPG